MSPVARPLAGPQSSFARRHGDRHASAATCARRPARVPPPWRRTRCAVRRPGTVRGTGRHSRVAPSSPAKGRASDQRGPAGPGLRRPLRLAGLPRSPRLRVSLPVSRITDPGHTLRTTRIQVTSVRRLLRGHMPCLGNAGKPRRQPVVGRTTGSAQGHIACRVPGADLARTSSPRSAVVGVPCDARVLRSTAAGQPPRRPVGPSADPNEVPQQRAHAGRQPTSGAASGPGAGDGRPHPRLAAAPLGARAGLTSRVRWCRCEPAR